MLEWLSITNSLIHVIFMHRHTIKTKIRTKALKSFRIHQDDNAVNVSEFLFYKSSETKNAEGRSMHHHA